MQLLTVSPSPHVRSGMTTQKIMGLVLLALLPAAVCGVIFFGIRALLLMLFCILISMATEAICQKLMKKPVTISDGSAALTGLLLALNLPATLPLWKADFILLIAYSFFVGRDDLGTPMVTMCIRPAWRAESSRPTAYIQKRCINFLITHEYPRRGSVRSPRSPYRRGRRY